MIFSWKEVLLHLKNLSEDDSQIEKLIEKQLKEIIKETHPRDWRNFTRRNTEQLGKIKLQLKEKYSREIKKRIQNFISLTGGF